MLNDIVQYWNLPLGLILDKYVRKIGTNCKLFYDDHLFKYLSSYVY